jgi:hypothetical protein
VNGVLSIGTLSPRAALAGGTIADETRPAAERPPARTDLYPGSGIAGVRALAKSFAVEPLPPPDCHHLSAAIGWLELGNAAEAELELLRVSATYVLHPAVLETRFAIHADRRHWTAALPVAEQLVELLPEQVSGWLHRAYALRRVPGGGLRAAWSALLPALEKFPNEATVPFNLACYACQLGEPERAWDLLYRAVQTGGEKQIVAMALADADLAPLRERITEYYAVDRC